MYYCSVSQVAKLLNVQSTASRLLVSLAERLMTRTERWQYYRVQQVTSTASVSELVCAASALCTI
eukprot:21471-Heterococcus_DN1.PRE.6